MSENKIKTEDSSINLTSVISTAIKVPGVKVDRDSFLKEQFKGLTPDVIELVVKEGPVNAGISREELRKKAIRIIKTDTAVSTGASFAAGIPGGIAMAATIPADMIQFYAVALRMAQELVYLYGEEDIWCDGTPDAEKVTNQLILYCGVMLGASGAAQAVRVMSSAVAKQLLKTLPQKTLTKTLYYPVIKTILKFFGVSLTKSTFAKGVAKVVPVVGGVVSGGITFASMLPMGKRLMNTLDKAHFDYTASDFREDMDVINKITEEETDPDNPGNKTFSAADEIMKYKQLLDMGAITQEEFDMKKKQLLEQ